MKNLITISLFIFWAVVTATLVAGLIFYQERQIATNQGQFQLAGQEPASSGLTGVTTLGGSVSLSMQELVKHNKISDCWLLISGKFYNITSYFGSHPGGSGAMSPLCGKDATAAYSAKDPSAATVQGSAHSVGAKSLLAGYYIGDLNQVIGQQKIQQTNAIVPPAITEDDDEDDD